MKTQLIALWIVVIILLSSLSVSLLSAIKYRELKKRLDKLETIVYNTAPVPQLNIKYGTIYCMDGELVVEEALKGE